MWRRWVAIGLGAIVVGAAAWWAFHPRPSEREQIEELVARAEHGIETKSMREIMGCVAPNYQDSVGLTKTDIWRLATHWVRDTQEVDVVIEDYTIDVQPPKATGRFAVRLVEVEAGEHDLPSAMSLTVAFEKQRQRLGSRWLVTSVGGPELDALLGEVM